MRLLLQVPFWKPTGTSSSRAATGEEGLRQYKKHNPDLLMLDLMMEEIDTGTSMVRDLKLAGCTAPIFVISSVGEALRDSADATELGLGRRAAKTC